jgi:hypothetical protein
MCDPDADGDGVPNIEEEKIGTNPLIVDTDGDGYSDAEEAKQGSSPTDPGQVPPGIYSGGCSSSGPTSTGSTTFGSNVPNDRSSGVFYALALIPFFMRRKRSFFLALLLVSSVASADQGVQVSVPRELELSLTSPEIGSEFVTVPSSQFKDGTHF